MNVLLFAGQGAQAVGMGRDLAEAFPECRALLTRAGEILGYDLAKLCWEGPESELVKSQHCQPAIFVVSAMCELAWRRARPAAGWRGLAGLSLGEWTALYAAGVIAFDDAVRILEARGRFMQEACEAQAGAMLSVIGLSADTLRPLASKAGVELANLNSPEQTVLSGPRAGIETAEVLAKEAGAKRVVRLNVAGAYHSRLMEPAARKLENFLAPLTFAAPRVAVVANATGLPHGTPDEIKRTMVRQVTSSVQWVAGIQWFRQHGVTRYLECGPGKVLSGLVKRIHPEAALGNIQDRSSLEKNLAEWPA